MFSDYGKQWEIPPAMLQKIFCQLLCIGLFLPAPSYANDLMLPEVYNGQVDVSGWLMSEKLDGVRGYWDGKRLLSKNGTVFSPPAAFVRDLPTFAVEGEIWGGRGSFEQTVAIVKKEGPHNGWQQLRLAIFDVPNAPGGFTERIAKAEKWFAAHPSAYAFVIPQTIVGDPTDLSRQLAGIEKLGGEGLIVRKPDAPYAAGRSTEILKVKNYQDAEAVVVAHLPGKGRNTGRLGALLVELDDGRQCRIGGGFSDAERQSPPPIGAVITYKHYGTYQSGLPKFPSFLRIRGDEDL
ncbi:DNA ligase [Desulfopila sp. IMCC35006]|uniref:DNA ligase n=1 Tax=Desulfopila sp. IMCC35006 TaxID=2569542 RepID=UPI00197AEBAA|nr:DNA ligase [Desulfopila sp. IMCC35006]